MSTLHLILPAGTHVVSRVDTHTIGKTRAVPAGSVGVIVAPPADHTHAYGLAGPDSDVDRHGIYLPPAELHWSLYGVPEQLENRETEEVYWEVQKFIRPALKANPNILECLYTSLVEDSTPLADELRANTHRFLSQLVYQTFNGYALSQFKRIEQDVRTTGLPKWKHAMHLIRLLLSGIASLRKGAIPVQVEEHRDRLLAIKRGEAPWEEVNEWRLSLHRQFDQALGITPATGAAGLRLGQRLPDSRAAERSVSWVPGEDPRLLAEAATHPYPLLFTTVSGAHLYGFPSPDSDFDLRGAHVLPAMEIFRFGAPEWTTQSSHERSGIEVDLVTHDVKKFFSLLLRNNGYVLEQLYSPLIVHTTPEHEELKAIARGCVTRMCSRHYLGVARNQWRLFEKEDPPRVKPLLYLYRVLLTGIHMMRTGEVNANLIECNEIFRLPYIDELVARKTTRTERAALPDADLAFHRAEYERLNAMLLDVAERSQLPERATSRAALEDLLLRIRMAAFH